MVTRKFETREDLQFAGCSSLIEDPLPCPSKQLVDFVVDFVGFFAVVVEEALVV